MSGKILENAKARGADMLIVACPLCHMNVDSRQIQMKPRPNMPALYFTQLMAVAFGVPQKAALPKNLIDPRPLLKEKGFL
jgi:heterodisulfide reductase subunit B